MAHDDQDRPPGIHPGESRSERPGDACRLTEGYRRGCVLLVLLTVAGCDPAPDPNDVLRTTAEPSAGGGAPVVLEPVTRLSYGPEIFRDTINSFVVIEERSKVEAAHAPSRWIHLSFDTPDRHVNVTLTDDGANLSATATTSACSSAVRPLQYEGSEDESDLYADLEFVLKSCVGRLEGADPYPRLLKAAKPGFPEAVRIMEQRAVQAFGGTSRCRLREPHEQRSAHDPCF